MVDFGLVAQKFADELKVHLCFDEKVGIKDANSVPDDGTLDETRPSTSFSDVRLQSPCLPKETTAGELSTGELPATGNETSAVNLPVSGWTLSESENPSARSVISDDTKEVVDDDEEDLTTRNMVVQITNSVIEPVADDLLPTTDESVDGKEDKAASGALQDAISLESASIASSPQEIAPSAEQGGRHGDSTSGQLSDLLILEDNGYDEIIEIEDEEDVFELEIKSVTTRKEEQLKSINSFLAETASSMEHRRPSVAESGTLQGPKEQAQDNLELQATIKTLKEKLREREQQKRDVLSDLMDARKMVWEWKQDAQRAQAQVRQLLKQNEEKINPTMLRSAEDEESSFGNFRRKEPQHIDLAMSMIDRRQGRRASSPCHTTTVQDYLQVQEDQVRKLTSDLCDARMVAVTYLKIIEERTDVIHQLEGEYEKSRLKQLLTRHPAGEIITSESCDTANRRSLFTVVEEANRPENIPLGRLRPVPALPSNMLHSFAMESFDEIQPLGALRGSENGKKQSDSEVADAASANQSNDKVTGDDDGTSVVFDDDVTSLDPSVALSKTSTQAALEAKAAAEAEAAAEPEAAAEAKAKADVACARAAQVMVNYAMVDALTKEAQTDTDIASTLAAQLATSVNDAAEDDTPRSENEGRADVIDAAMPSGAVSAGILTGDAAVGGATEHAALDSAADFVGEKNDVRLLTAWMAENALEKTFATEEKHGDALGARADALALERMHRASNDHEVLDKSTAEVTQQICQEDDVNGGANAMRPAEKEVLRQNEMALDLPPFDFPSPTKPLPDATAYFQQASEEAQVPEDTEESRVQRLVELLEAVSQRVSLRMEDSPRLQRGIDALKRAAGFHCAANYIQGQMRVFLTRMALRHDRVRRFSESPSSDSGIEPLGKPSREIFRPASVPVLSMACVPLYTSSGESQESYSDGTLTNGYYTHSIELESRSVQTSLRGDFVVLRPTNRLNYATSQTDQFFRSAKQRPDNLSMTSRQRAREGSKPQLNQHKKKGPAKAMKMFKSTDASLRPLSWSGSRIPRGVKIAWGASADEPAWPADIAKTLPAMKLGKYSAFAHKTALPAKAQQRQIVMNQSGLIHTHHHHHYHVFVDDFKKADGAALVYPLRPSARRAPTPTSGTFSS